MRFFRAGAVVAILTLPLPLTTAPAYAAGKTLEFQLVTKYLEPQTLEATNVADQAITQSKAFGVAVFKDGRIGTKDFIVALDKHKGAGTAFGYSTYTFDDGSITARFTGAFDSKGGHGDYTILSGTGAYAGATGTGTYDKLQNPYTGTGLFRVRLAVVTQAATQ